jgi:hypothetical protein
VSILLYKALVHWLAVAFGTRGFRYSAFDRLGNPVLQVTSQTTGTVSVGLRTVNIAPVLSMAGRFVFGMTIQAKSVVPEITFNSGIFGINYPAASL